MSRLHQALNILSMLGALAAAFSLLGPKTQASELLLSLWGMMSVPSLILTTASVCMRLKWAAALGFFSSTVVLAGTLPSLHASPNVPDPSFTLVWSNVLEQPDAVYATITYAEDTNADIVLIGEWPTWAEVQLPAAWSLVSSSCRGQPVTALSRGKSAVCQRSLHHHRGSVVIRIEDVTIVAMHAAAPFVPDGIAARTEHFERAIVSSANGGPAIVVGDFNTVPWSPALDPFAHAGFTRAGIGARTTWLGKHHTTGLAIDHAFGRDLELEVSVGPFTGSDHYPILVQAKVAKTP